jgi:hypothetical protein
MTRPSRPGPGGKLALFEVLRGGDDAPAAASASAAAPAPSRSYDGPAMFDVSTDGGRIQLSVAPMIGVAVAGLMVASVGVAFFFGRASAGRVTQELPTAGAGTTELRPEVLDLSDPEAHIAMPAATMVPLPETVRVTSTPVQAAAEPAVVSSAEQKRVLGLNYLLVQSYHPSERAGAEATVAILQNAGIGATIETGVRGWSSYLCVVGTEPFKRISRNPELEAYKARLERVGQEQAGRRGIKRFDPHMIRWGR